jgi:hypothetical protein
MPKRATEKQKIAMKKVIENRGNISRAMIDAGYSEATAKNPSNLTKSKSWQELMDDFLPEDLLVKEHRKLVKAYHMDTMDFLKEISDDEIIQILEDINCTVKRIIEFGTNKRVYFWSPDNLARKNALDLAYKLRGSYAPIKSEVTFGNKSEEDIKKEFAEKVSNLFKNVTPEVLLALTKSDENTGKPKADNRKAGEKIKKRSFK